MAAGSCTIPLYLQQTVSNDLCPRWHRQESSAVPRPTLLPARCRQSWNAGEKRPCWRRSVCHIKATCCVVSALGTSYSLPCQPSLVCRIYPDLIHGAPCMDKPHWQHGTRRDQTGVHCLLAIGNCKILLWEEVQGNVYSDSDVHQWDV